MATEADRRRRQREYHAYLDAQVRDKNGGEKGARPSKPATPPLPPLVPMGDSARRVLVQPESRPETSAGPLEGGHLEKLLLEEVHARRELGQVVAQLAKELESSHRESARQREVTEQSRQADAAAAAGLRDRLRIVETELVEARSARVELERELSNSSVSAVSTVVDGLKRELDAERTLRERLAEDLKASQATSRQLAMQLNTLSDTIDRVQQANQDSVKELEGAIGREKQRQGEWFQQSIETKGKVEGLSGALEQRVQALSGDMAILKEAVTRSEEARTQAVDIVAQAKQELAIVVDQAAKDAVKHHLVTLDREHREPGETEKSGHGEWRVRMLEEQLEAKLGGLSQRMGVMEGVLAEERTMRREHFDESLAEARRQTESVRQSMEAMTAANNASTHKARQAFAQKINDLKMEMDRNNDTLRRAGHELSKSSVESVRALHSAIEQLQGSQGTKLLELEQVLSAEIQARRGSSQILNSSIQAVEEKGRTEVMLRLTNLEQALQQANAKAEEARKSSNTAMELSHKASAHLSTINNDLAQQKVQLRNTGETIKEECATLRQGLEQRSNETSQKLEHLHDRVGLTESSLNVLKEQLGMVKHELEGAIALGLSDMRSLLHNRCDVILDDLRAHDKDAKSRLGIMHTAVQDAKAIMEEEVRKTVQAAQEKFSKQMTALGHTVANCVVGCERLKDELRLELAELGQKSEESLAQVKASLHQTLDTAHTKTDSRLSEVQHEHQTQITSVKDGLERANGRLNAGERATAGVLLALNQAEERLKTGISDAIEGQAEVFREQFKGERTRTEARINDESLTLRAAIREACSAEERERMQAVAISIDRCGTELAASVSHLEALVEEKAISVQDAACARVADETRRRHGAVEAFKDKHKSIEVRAEVKAVLDSVVNQVADSSSAQDASDAYAKIWRSMGLDAQAKAKDVRDLKAKLDASVETLLRAIRDMDNMSSSLKDIARDQVEEKAKTVMEEVHSVRAGALEAVKLVEARVQELESQSHLLKQAASVSRVSSEDPSSASSGLGVFKQKSSRPLVDENHQKQETQDAENEQRGDELTAEGDGENTREGLAVQEAAGGNTSSN